MAVVLLMSPDFIVPFELKVLVRPVGFDTLNRFLRMKVLYLPTNHLERYSSFLQELGKSPTSVWLKFRVYECGGP